MTVLKASSINRPSHMIAACVESSPKRIYEEKMRPVHRKGKRVVRRSIDAVHAARSRPSQFSRGGGGVGGEGWRVVRLMWTSWSYSATFLRLGSRGGSDDVGLR